MLWGFFGLSPLEKMPKRTVEPKRPSEMNVEMNKGTGEHCQVNRPPGLAQREWSEANLSRLALWRLALLAFEGSVFPSQSDSTPAASEHGPIERNVGFVVL